MRRSSEFKKYQSKWRRQCFQYHPVFGWWHIPNLSARLMLGQTFGRLYTNNIGMRDHRNFSKTKSADKCRIIVLGDSYTAGDGVSNHQRATALLEQRFSNLEILNFALNGSGTDQQLLIFETLAKKYQADAYIWGICVENIIRNICTCFPSYNWSEHQTVFRPKPWFSLARGASPAGKLKLHHSPVPREQREADHLGAWKKYDPMLLADKYSIYKDPHSEPWQLMKAIIQRFLKQVEGKPVYLVPLPLWQHFICDWPPYYLPRFEELQNRKKRIHVIDVLPAMKRMSPAWHDFESLIFPDDPHYNASGHFIVANAVDYHLRYIYPELPLASTHQMIRNKME